MSNQKYDLEKMLADGNKSFMDAGQKKVWIESARDGFAAYNADEDKMYMVGCSEHDRQQISKYRVVA